MEARWNKYLDDEPLTYPGLDIVERMREESLYWLGQAAESFEEGELTPMWRCYFFDSQMNVVEYVDRLTTGKPARWAASQVRKNGWDAPAGGSLLHNLQMQIFQLLRIHLARRVDHQVLRRRSLGKRHDVANIFGRHQHHQRAFNS